MVFGNPNTLLFNQWQNRTSIYITFIYSWCLLLITKSSYPHPSISDSQRKPIPMHDLPTSKNWRYIDFKLEKNPFGRSIHPPKQIEATIQLSTQDVNIFLSSWLWWILVSLVTSFIQLVSYTNIQTLKQSQLSKANCDEVR